VESSEWYIAAHGWTRVLVGVDIYDCVLVINTYKALEAFTSIRCTLGGEISAVAGPVGIGGVLESEVHKRQAPVLTYLKSRGFYAGVQVDGTIVIERTDENEIFYGQRIGVADILAGKALNPPKEKYRLLLNTIRAAQGDAIAESDLPSSLGPTPGDFEVDSEGSFGIPDVEDPDPYGVKALEEAGIEIRDAKTHEKPAAEAFVFQPSPSSPIYSSFARKSIDGHQRDRSGSWRNSMASVASVDRGTQTGEEEVSMPMMDGLGVKPAPPPLPPRELSGASSVYEEEKDKIVLIGTGDLAEHSLDERLHDVDLKS